MTAPLSIQLYTVREALAADQLGTLRRLVDIGFRQVEPYGLAGSGAGLAPDLVSAGLSAPSAHSSLTRGGLDGLFAAAREVGVETIIDPKIDPARWTSRADIRAIAWELGEVAARAADVGLRIGYHNHAFELENRIGGVSALEVFADDLDERIVLELDTYWAEVGGEPAPELLRRLGDRVQLIHVKDGPRTKADVDQVAVGAGSLPIAEIIAAAPEALRVIELDGYAGDVFEAVADSYRFLAEGIDQ